MLNFVLLLLEIALKILNDGTLKKNKKYYKKRKLQMMNAIIM